MLQEAKRPLHAYLVCSRDRVLGPHKCTLKVILVDRGERKKCNVKYWLVLSIILNVSFSYKKNIYFMTGERKNSFCHLRTSLSLWFFFRTLDLIVSVNLGYVASCITLFEAHRVHEIREWPIVKHHQVCSTTSKNWGGGGTIKMYALLFIKLPCKGKNCIHPLK